MLGFQPLQGVTGFLTSTSSFEIFITSKDSSPQHPLFSLWEIQGISNGRLFWILLSRVDTQSCFLTYLFLKSMQLGIERTPLSLCFSDLYHTVTKFTHLKRADCSLHLFGSARQFLSEGAVAVVTQLHLDGIVPVAGQPKCTCSSKAFSTW